jgi:peroxiredoxin
MSTSPVHFPTIDFTTIGPAVGQPFPALALPDQHGQLIDLHRARAGRRALVLFYRSADW